jgi:hypothetical protein
VELDESSTIDDAAIEDHPAEAAPVLEEKKLADEKKAPETPEPLIEQSTDEETGDKGVAEPDIEAEKAAEAERKRHQELQKYIDRRDYYVPINAVERRRSIKVSVLLTFVVLLLSIALIDLMLDSGFIELINRLPHTHFFSIKH